MIEAKIDSMAAATIREKGIESVVDWFEVHLESFYSLGWFYLHDASRMEELFYRSALKVHKELPRFKSDMSFDMWVTSIFIDNCRELSHAGGLQVSEGKQDVFNALDELEAVQKEAMLLIYVKGFSQEEAAQILRVSPDKMKELLYSGIESVREKLTGLTYNGCKEYRKNYLDYLEKTMARPEKIEFEKHIYHCRDCQEDLASFQEVAVTRLSFAESMNGLQAPPYFMENLKMKLLEKKKNSQQKNKKRMKVALLFASVFAVVIAIGVFTGAVSYAYYGLTEEDEQLRKFLQKDLGQRVKLEAESDGVKIKITGVVADDFQTLVFYKIEDTGDGNQFYVSNGDDGLIVENESEIMNRVSYPRFQFPDLKAEMNKKNKNVFYGKIGLLPLNTDKGTVDIKINRLIQLNQDASDPIGLSFRNTEYKEGDWEFKVPVTKQPSIEYTLDEQTEIEGIPVRFNRLTISPTATILDYGINIRNPEKRIDFLNFDGLEVNNEKLKTDLFGSDFTTSYQDVNWNSFQVRFDTLFGKKPEEIKVYFKSANLAFEDDKSIELDLTKEFPQTFEYAGSTISIDKVDIGQPTTIVLSDHEVNNREYEMFQMDVMGENENEYFSMSMDTEGVFVDRSGDEFDPSTSPFDYENPEQPRHFVTEQTIRLEGNNVIPKRINITGYSTTRYLDNVVEISVE